MPYTQSGKTLDRCSEEACRWKAYAEIAESKVPMEHLVSLPAKEQVVRGKQLLQMLKPGAPAVRTGPARRHEGVRDQHKGGALASTGELSAALAKLNAGLCPPAYHGNDALKLEVVIRRTFIELVASSTKPSRRRALTESALDEIRSSQENTTYPPTPVEMSEVSTSPCDADDDSDFLRLNSKDCEDASRRSLESASTSAAPSEMRMPSHTSSAMTSTSSGSSHSSYGVAPAPAPAAGDWMTTAAVSSWPMQQGYEGSVWMACPVEAAMVQSWACYAVTPAMASATNGCSQMMSAGMGEEYGVQGQYLAASPRDMSRASCNTASGAASREQLKEANAAHVQAKAAAATQLCDDDGDERKTTVMLRNLPSHFVRSTLHQLLEDAGMDKCFDFLYMPMDFSSRRSLGYAIVNFVTHKEAVRCWNIFQGSSRWEHAGHNGVSCEVVWSHPLQGLQAHVERYRSSPTMHESIPEEWKPAVFSGGVRIPFPAPTKPIKAPKTRSRAEKSSSH